MSPRPAPSRRTAFTLMELIMGLSIMSMIAMAIGGLSAAVGASWEGTQSTQFLQVATRQATAELDRMLRGARFVGLACPAGAGAGAASPPYNASIMLWAADTNNDGKMQASEIQLIEFNPASSSLLLYAVPANTTAGNTLCTNTDISTTNDLATFKAMTGCTSRTLASDVTAATFALYNPNDPNQKPTVEYVMTFNDATNTQSRVFYSSVTLRAQAPQP